MKFYIRPKKKEEILSTLKELGESFLKDVEEGRNPSVEVPVRTLRNIKFDAKERKIFLGGYVAKRYLLHLGQIRSFTQLTGIAALSKKLIEENKHVSLREAFYILKRNIPGLKYC